MTIERLDAPHKILLGLTTTPDSDWRGKIEETKHFNLTEIALFPTYLKPDERKVLYDLLKETPVNSIPHVHARDDFSIEEVEYLIKNYGTKRFNFHFNEGEEVLSKFCDFADLIYFENGAYFPDDALKSLSKCAGLCIDFSHLYQHELADEEKYKIAEDMIDRFPVNCCHVSAIRNNASEHTLIHEHEIDYINNYLEYLPNLISIELENSFKEQLHIKERIKSIISAKAIY